MSSPSFLSWTCKHPENWSEAEVLDWLYYSAERNGIDCSLLPGEAFHSVKGRDLCRMSADDFQSLEPRFGQYFYSLFRQLLNGRKYYVLLWGFENNKGAGQPAHSRSLISAFVIRLLDMIKHGEKNN